MKIKIAYTESESKRADELAALFVKELEQGCSVSLKRSDRHKPYYHIYIADNRKKA